MKLIKRTEIEQIDETYNLHIQNDHNYIVNGAVVSNCHTAKAAALKTLLTGVMSHIPIRLGLTGTIPKEMFESQALLVSIGPIVNRLSANHLQEQGVLANCHVNIVQMLEHLEHKTYHEELKYLLETETRLDAMAKLIYEVSKTGNTLVLIDRVLPGKMLLDRLPGAVFLSGQNSASERQVEYDSIAVSDNNLTICTYGIAAVGINVPRIMNLVLIEPGKSFVRVIQSIGRSLRKAEGKDHANIWDITSTCKFSKRHLAKRKQFYKEAKYEFSQEKLIWQ